MVAGLPFDPVFTLRGQNRPVTARSAKRFLTPSERRLLDRLLGAKFVGSDELASQIQTAMVETIDECGSLRFYVSNHDIVCVSCRVPVEGEFKDSDGIAIHVLLHVVDGVASELEIHRDDGSSIESMPDPNDLEVFSAEQ